MKIKHLPISSENGYKPELIASILARYSRNGEGIDSILEKVDGMDQEKAIDLIFSHVDYGHQSIADMVPVALTLDEISMDAALFIFNSCPVASGQESSTRYIEMKEGSVVGLQDWMINPHYEDLERYDQFINNCFECYYEALSRYNVDIQDNPSIITDSKSLDLNNPKHVKIFDRLKRNYAFDRARYFLPLKAKTGMGLIQSSREWVKLVRDLLSYPDLEFQKIGEEIRQILMVVSPRMVKYAVPQQSSEAYYDQLINYKTLSNQYKTYQPTCGGKLEISDKSFDFSSLFTRESRYSRCPHIWEEVLCTFSWNSIPLAELRDLNRHRTGKRKYYKNYVTGFYPGPTEWAKKMYEEKILPFVSNGSDYFHTLGTTVSFLHLTTFDNFVYEAELRTGLGTHYKYREAILELLDCEPWIYDLIEVGGGEIE